MGTDPALLAAAIRRHDLPIITALLLAGANPNAKDPLGYPPLAIACGLGAVSVVEMLLCAGADPLLIDCQMGASPMHKAAQRGVPQVANLLLMHGAFIDVQSPTHGYTPLIDAAWNKRIGMVRFLLDAGANSHIKAHAGFDVREMAEGDNEHEIIALIDAARQRVAERERSFLRGAALRGDREAIVAAIQKGADVNELAPDGHTPLLDAAREGHAEVVAELLAARANPCIVDHLMKATPAHKAAYMGHPDVLRLLVQHGGVELEAQGPYNGYTALHDAVWHGHLEAARVLVYAGVRLDLRALDGRTPLEMAEEYGYSEIAALLKDAMKESGEGKTSAGVINRE